MPIRLLVSLMTALTVVSAEADVTCTDSSGYNFLITRRGDGYHISGDQWGSYKGRCNAELLRSSNGRTLLQGTTSNAYERKQCYAEIALGEKYGSEVSVPNDTTYGAVKGELLFCTGNL